MYTVSAKIHALACTFAETVYFVGGGELLACLLGVKIDALNRSRNHADSYQ